MAYNSNQLTGFLNIYKEAGFTSFDVIAKLRGILHQKKIGHMGTLDPDATGVLPVALGNATRTLSLLPDHTKAYRAVMLLGTETDTYDTSGQVLRRMSYDNVDEAFIRDVFDNYKGKLNQIPPMYSAKKVNGKKLYELAREGIEIERAAVPIEIYSIKIEKIELPQITFEVECSKGTYIRSLIHDIGKDLGCGACMSSLIRTRSGVFGIEEAYSLESVERIFKEEKIEELIMPIDEAFNDMQSVKCKSGYYKKAINGNPLLRNEIVSEGKETDIVRVYLEDNKFLGLYEWRGKRLCPRKVLV